VSVFLIGVGFIINLVCGVWIIVQAFRVSTGWGLAVIFLPFASLFFIIKHWSDTKKPFLGSVASVVLIILGLVIAPTPEPEAEAAESRRASRSTESPDEAPQANYASAAAPAAPYEPRRTAYQPTAYTPSYNPPQQPAPAVATDTQAVEDEWSRKPVYEQVYVDRATNTFVGEKCKKRPENAYRIPRSVALMQGMTEGKCR
jgi:hypothetical protein